jgi:phosphopantothenoylcysteine decarboxylase/phosphopantothenate--cysteine ligase
MNTAMWAHPATTASVTRLTGMGVRVLSPEAGALACGESGAGRLMEPETLVLHVLAQLGTKIA